jgi:hypothetical protein
MGWGEACLVDLHPLVEMRRDWSLRTQLNGMNSLALVSRLFTLVEVGWVCQTTPPTPAMNSAI